MKTSSPILVSILIPTFAAALGAQSCAGGETAVGMGSGGSTTSGSGGRVITGSGGSTSFGSGGSTTTTGSGGSTSFGSGGSTTSGSGGRAATGSGGSTFGSGGSTFGSGGSSFGSGGSTTTGSGGSPVSTGALTVMDGYGTSGTWMGYAYTFTGPATGSKGTIAPANFMGMTSVCAMGMITADPMYLSVAGLGWNINQAKGTTAAEPPIMTVATSGTGLEVNVTVTGLTLAAGSGSPLRAQIKASADYCAPIAASGVSKIPWSMFNTKCWNTAETGAMAFAAGTAIKAVELIVPSTTTAVGPFNICLVDARPY